MTPKKHILFGFIFSLILYLFFNLNLIQTSLIFLSSFFIDFDHYLYYVFKKKDFNLKNAVNWFFKRKEKYLKFSREQKNKVYTGFYFLHGIEILIILFLLGFFVLDYFYFIFIGFTFHLFLDLIHGKKYQDRVDKISIIYDYFKFKKLKEI